MNKSNEVHLGNGLWASWNGHYYRIRSVDGSEVHIDSLAFENLCHYVDKMTSRGVENSFAYGEH